MFIGVVLVSIENINEYEYIISYPIYTVSCFYTLYIYIVFTLKNYIMILSSITAFRADTVILGFRSWC